jgi:glycosyltransferase involved in cell wall biosynthesis
MSASETAAAPVSSAQSPLSPAHVAVVVPALRESGGVATVGRFIHRVLDESDAYDPAFISVPLSSRDPASLRLLDPETWRRGAVIEEETWEGYHVQHVGAVGAELEFQRYRPRRPLTTLLNRFDLIQIVAGTPAWGWLAKNVTRPVALQVATRSHVERKSAWAKAGWMRQLWGRLMGRITRRLENRAFQHVDAVFVENAWMLDYVTDHCPDSQVHFSPPGVDVDQFRPGPSERSSCNLEDVPDDYILSVGRFSDPRKNAALLLEAYGRLVARRRDGGNDTPSLVLAGRTPPPDSAWARLSAYDATDQVTYLGEVDADALRDLYRHARAFVLSSDEEGLGLVLLEAMASGIPVVSTNCGGPSTLIDSGKNGFLTPVGNADALAEAVDRILQDPGKAQTMGETGRERAVTDFSISAAGQRFLDVYDQLLR